MMINHYLKQAQGKKKESQEHDSVFIRPFNSTPKKQGGHGLNSKPVKKSEMGSGKGVGGYRPPKISLRDKAIALRRKNTAECQIVWCIIISGVVIILAGVIISVLAFTVISSQCPFEWILEEDRDSCYYRTGHNTTFNEAYNYCMDQGGYMLHILDQEENIFFNGVKTGATWLGMTRNKEDSTWRWTSSKKRVSDSVTNWVSQQEDTAYCAQLVEPGDWMPAKCESEAFVICEFKPGYNPFVLIGPVIALCGVILLLLSIETCIRRREFLEKNGTELMDDVDDPHEIDAGLTNYGYGNFAREDSPKKLPWPVSVPSNKTAPASVKVSREDLMHVSRAGSPPQSPGPVVHVVPASIPTSPSAIPHHPGENTPSQEHLELLLSPKTLQ